MSSMSPGMGGTDQGLSEPLPVKSQVPGGGLFHIGTRKSPESAAEKQDLGRFPLFAEPREIPESISG